MLVVDWHVCGGWVWRVYSDRLRSSLVSESSARFDSPDKALANYNATH